MGRRRAVICADGYPQRVINADHSMRNRTKLARRGVTRVIAVDFEYNGIWKQVLESKLGLNTST